MIRLPSMVECTMRRLHSFLGLGPPFLIVQNCNVALSFLITTCNYLTFYIYDVFVDY